MPRRLLPLEHLPAEVPQHLRGAALTNAHADGALVESSLVGCQPGHGRQVRESNFGCRDRNLKPVAVITEAGAAVERLLVGVVELEARRPRLARVNPFDVDLDQDISRLLLAGVLVTLTHAQVSPQQVRRRHRQCYQVAAVDRDARAFLRHVARPALFHPSTHPSVPQRQRLQRRCLARVVRTDKDDAAGKLDLYVLEQLEIAEV